MATLLPLTKVGMSGEYESRVSWVSQGGIIQGAPGVLIFLPSAYLCPSPSLFVVTATQHSPLLYLTFFYSSSFPFFYPLLWGIPSDPQPFSGHLCVFTVTRTCHFPCGPSLRDSEPATHVHVTCDVSHRKAFSINP